MAEAHSTGFGLLLPLAGAGIIALVIARCFCLFQVRGASMRPTLEEGEWVLGRRWLPWERPLVGAVVIAQPQGGGRLLVKRLIAGPGDHTPGEGVGQFTAVPEGSYLLAGDSSPALSIGPVPRRDLRAVAVLVIWPPRCLRRVHRCRSEARGDASG